MFCSHPIDSVQFPKNGGYAASGNSAGRLQLRKDEMYLPPLKQVGYGEPVRNVAISRKPGLDAPEYFGTGGALSPYKTGEFTKGVAGSSLPCSIGSRQVI